MQATQQQMQQRQALRQRKRAGLFSDILLEARDEDSKLRKVADAAAAHQSQLQFGDLPGYAERAFRTRDPDTTDIGTLLDVLTDFANKLPEDQASWS